MGAEESPRPAVEEDEFSFADFQIFREHCEQAERFRKTLYYGQLPKYTDRPSFALTSIALEFFTKCLPPQDELRFLDMHFASKVLRNACVTPCSLVVALMYAERLRSSNPQYLAKTNSCDLFLVSMMVASKFLYDDGADDEVYNEEWAKAADLELSALNAEERNFLTAIDWNLLVRPPQFGTVLEDIERRIALREVAKRKGLTTYTDLCVLTSRPKVLSAILHVIYDHLVKVITVSLMGYCACLFTVAASVGTLSMLHIIPTPRNSDLSTKGNTSMAIRPIACQHSGPSGLYSDILCEHEKELESVLRGDDILNATLECAVEWNSLSCVNYENDGLRPAPLPPVEVLEKADLDVRFEDLLKQIKMSTSVLPNRQIYRDSFSPQMVYF